MSGLRELESASGLRPASAFVLIGAVLILVGLRSVEVTLIDDGEQPRNLTQLPAPDVTFDLVDRSGVPLALSVETLELVMSPNAMWQAHTPDKMARVLAGVLGGTVGEPELLQRMLPDAQRGVIHVDPRSLRMERAAARRVHEWLKRGSLDPEDEARPVRGMWIRPLANEDEFGLSWVPLVVLSESTRAEHGYGRPLDWTRHIADDLTVCLAGDAVATTIDTEDERKRWRKAVWDALIPTQFKSVIKEMPATAALYVHDMLKHERVGGHQMSLRRHAKRMYPAQAGVKDDPPLAVLGHWGTLDPQVARKRARAELHLPDDEHCTELELALLADQTSKRVYQPSPMNGLELLCDNLLRRPEWAQHVERRAEQYTFLANQVPRQAPVRYFQELVPPTETPRMVTTLDVGVSRQMRARLEDIMDKHQPAIAMAIALDVATGEVLAVDALDPYDAGGFLPTMHLFTPGSTTKVVIMAAALDEGVVEPSTLFDTHDGHYRMESRVIREAEGALTGRISASQGLAYSINAVLVQIGVRIPAENLHARFQALGYGRDPQSGLGGERTGRIPKLPWKRQFAHASVSFGHEMMVSLWQQAAALATVVRGGEYRPLTLVRGVEQRDARHFAPLAEPRRIFGAEACAHVREMMYMGAREGTGKKVYCDGIVMGTKTGTAQKVPGEVCLHVELAHNREHHCNGARACRAKLASQRVHKSSCYTSSMCAFGRLPNSDREVLVLVVVDEPRGGKKYGSDVAGPAAIAILQEALGYTRDGALPQSEPVAGFTTLETASIELSEEPWAEVTSASR